MTAFLELAALVCKFWIVSSHIKHEESYVSSVTQNRFRAAPQAHLLTLASLCAETTCMQRLGGLHLILLSPSFCNRRASTFKQVSVRERQLLFIIFCVFLSGTHRRHSLR